MSAERLQTNQSNHLSFMRHKKAHFTRIDYPLAAELEAKFKTPDAKNIITDGFFASAFLCQLAYWLERFGVFDEEKKQWRVRLDRKYILSELCLGDNVRRLERLHDQLVKAQLIERVYEKDRKGFSNGFYYAFDPRGWQRIASVEVFPLPAPIKEEARSKPDKPEKTDMKPEEKTDEKPRQNVANSQTEPDDLRHSVAPARQNVADFYDKTSQIYDKTSPPIDQYARSESQSPDQTIFSESSSSNAPTAPLVIDEEEDEEKLKIKTGVREWMQRLEFPAGDIEQLLSAYSPLQLHHALCQLKAKADATDVKAPLNFVRKVLQNGQISQNLAKSGLQPDLGLPPALVPGTQAVKSAAPVQAAEPEREPLDPEAEAFLQTEAAILSDYTKRIQLATDQTARKQLEAEKVQALKEHRLKRHASPPQERIQEQVNHA